MENAYYLPFALFLAAVYKLAVNAYRLWRVGKLRAMHFDYIRELAKPKGQGDPGWTVTQHKHEIATLFMRAGLKDFSFPRAQFAGYGYIATGQASVFDNTDSGEGQLAYATQQMFFEAEGVYRQRIRETFNPLYWIDSIIFLPAKLAQYLGAPSGSLIGRIGNVIMWFIGLATFVLSLPDFADTRKAFSAWLAGLLS